MTENMPADEKLARIAQQWVNDVRQRARVADPGDWCAAIAYSLARVATEAGEHAHASFLSRMANEAQKIEHGR